MVAEEKKIVEQLQNKKPMIMTQKVWQDLKNAVDCHVCNKKLVKGKFMDSLPVWQGVEEEPELQPDEECGVEEECPDDINYEDYDETKIANQDF